MITAQQKLYEAINECDALTLLCERHNDQARTTSRGGYAGDTLRLKRYGEMRAAIREHRQNLLALYVETYGVDPWANIPL